MNIFLGQSIQTRIELEEIADVKKQIITPSTSRTIIGIVQDGLLGAYNLTSPTMRIDWKSAMNIMSYTSIDDFEAFKKEKKYTGHELFSMILPPRINVQTAKLTIKNGELLEGHLSKDMLGSKKKNNLTQLIWDEHGAEGSKRFLDNTQRLINNFNLYNGFTINVGDMSISDEIDKQIQQLFETKDLKVNHMITEIENNPDIIDSELYERTLFSELNVAREDVSKLLLNNLTPLNNLGIMITSGSKGDATNLGQMGGCIGLQAFEGKLIPKHINNRTTSYFFENDDRSESRGLIKNSFMKGMKFVEFFYHNMTGREGLIDSAIKTAESGYIQRKIIKSLEDGKVHYDRTVRTATNMIMQYVYGDSGADTIKQYEYIIKIIEMGDKEIASNYKFTNEEMKSVKDFSESENDKYYKELIKMRDTLRTVQIKSKMSYITMSSGFMLPVNLTSTVENSRNEKDTGKTKLTPTYILETFDRIMKNDKTTLFTMTEKNRKNEKYVKNRDEQICKTVFKISLNDILSPKRCIIEYGLSKEKFDEIIDKICLSYTTNIVEPGEMAGIIAAQSMGEPTTQMSCVKETFIRLNNDTKPYAGTIGKFIDELLEKNKKNVKTISKDSIVLDLTDNYYVTGVSDKEKTSWKRISQVSRHPANGDLVKVHTKSGRDTTATLSHSFLKRTTNGIVPIKGSELKVGDRIPIAKYIPMIDKPSTEMKIGETMFELNKLFGWFIGAYLADGSLNGNHIKITKINQDFEKKMREFTELHGYELIIKNYQGEYGPGKDLIFKSKDMKQFLENNFSKGSYNKEIASFVYGSNLEFIGGIISGYFDGDGNVNSDKQMIRVGSRSEQLINDISILLSYFGIFGSKIEETTKNQVGKILYVYNIQRKYASIFKTKIGFYESYKAKELDKIITYNARDTKHSEMSLMDKIPELGETIAFIGKEMELPGQSRTYGRWSKKESIGRETLINYIELFEKAIGAYKGSKLNQIKSSIKTLKDASNADVVWDEIINLEIIKDSKEYVYDFTVPGNDSFMVDTGILVHNTLNSFHHSGIGALSTTTQGVPRVKELLSLSKNLKTPQLMIFLNKEYMDSRDMANKIASHIKYTTLGHLSNEIKVSWDPLPYEKGSIMQHDHVYNVYYTHNPGKNSCQSDITSLPWLMRIELDREKMLEKEVTLLDIKSKFCNMWEKRFSDSKSGKKEEKYILEKITQCAVLSNSDNDKQPVLHIRFDMNQYDIKLINDFIVTIIDKFKLKGLNSISDIGAISEERTLVFDGENHDVEKKKQFVIYTVGSNLYDIRYIKGIDIYKTICNDVIAIYDAFGIEAARATLIRELTLAYERSGQSVNYQHVALLADLMSSTGYLTSIDRHGMNKSDVDPLSRASFEKTVDQLLTAAVFGEVDNMKGISSRIIAGLVIKGGTGMCDVLLDTDLLEKTEYVGDSSQKYFKTFNEITTNNIIADVLNNDDTNTFLPDF
jgi:DNA-directed RNA polymerase beta' subunit